jgi:uncharacterized protein (DUF1330 family)
MNVENDVYPHRPGSIKMLQEPGPDGPIYMVNLLKFRALADYKDGRESALTGREAYNLYATEVTQVIQQHGGKILFSADVSGLLHGHVDELWDAVAIAQYPNRAALIAMSMSEALSEPSKHREAGLQGQLNIETVGTGLFD